MSARTLLDSRKRPTAAQKRLRASTVMLVASALYVPTLGAQTAPATVNYAAADVIPAYDSFTVSSKAMGETRKVNVWVPRHYKQATGTRFPVVYMPDGGTDEDFPHVANTIDSLIALKLVRPVIAVGIPNTERRRDMTGPTRMASDSAIAKRVGGSAAFRAFIRDELIPAVNTRYRTTGERTLLGESLAGLFVVETLLLEPTMFTHYVAFDPSLWWNKQALTAVAPVHLKSFDVKPRSLYLASSSEDIDDSRMEFVTMWRANSPKPVQMIFVPRQDLQHATIFRGEAAKALISALK